MLAESEKTIASTCEGVIFDTKTKGTKRLKLIMKFLRAPELKKSQVKSLMPRTLFHRMTKQKSEVLARICIRMVAVIRVLGSTC